MRPWQTLVKYGAIAFAVILIVNIAVWSLTAIGFIFGLSSSGEVGEERTFPTTSKITELDISLASASLTIKTEDVDRTTVKYNLEDLRISLSGDKLSVKEKHRLFNNSAENGAYVEIIFPLRNETAEHDEAPRRFESAEIEMGAGDLLIDRLYTDELDLSLGAGEARLNNIYADEGNIEGGAGKLHFVACEISDLELDMGVGELTIMSVLRHSNINIGIGDADITILGNKDDYKLILSKGIGEITVDGEDVGNGTAGNGEYKVKVNGGIGEINIKFAKAEPSKE